MSRISAVLLIRSIFNRALQNIFSALQVILISKREKAVMVKTICQWTAYAASIP